MIILLSKKASNLKKKCAKLRYTFPPASCTPLLIVFRIKIRQQEGVQTSNEVTTRGNISDKTTMKRGDSSDNKGGRYQTAATTGERVGGIYGTPRCFNLKIKQSITSEKFMLRYGWTRVKTVVQIRCENAIYPSMDAQVTTLAQKKRGPPPPQGG